MAPEDRSAMAARVASFVALHEGAHFREIQRSLGLATGQADHHLRRLVREGLLARTALGGEVHYFPASRPTSERRPLAALRHPARTRVARALLDGPAPLRTLAEATGQPESTLLHHLRALVRAGVVFRAQEGRRVAYGLSEPGHLRGLLPDAVEAVPVSGPAGRARPRPGTPLRPPR